MDRLKELRIDRTDKARRPGNRWVLAVIALLLVLAAAGGWWWLGRGSVAEVRIAGVEKAGAGVAEATVLDASGYVTARLRATVSSKITGKVVEVLVEEGMEIAEGQLLARLDDATATRLLALAEAQLGSARGSLAETQVLLADALRTLGRQRQLVSQEVSSQAQLDAAQAGHDALSARLALGREQVAVAQRQVELRRQDVDDTFIRAPFAGVAVTKNAQPGEMISPISAGGGFTRTGVCTLVDMGSLEIEVDVNEAYINRVEADQRVVAILDAYPGWKIPAAVITTVPTADRQKATVRVRIGFDELDPRILPDMGVKVSFLDTEEPEAGDQGSAAPRWTIPSQALRRDGSQDMVFVIEGEVVERRAIRVGPQNGDRVVVEAGLGAGDEVVVEGPEDLANGDRVKVE
ncbi:MAG: efflux RND transporter periplasmic adaptor subunit [bacterium]|nr:efflux RND transporter periplasmic adaptor subunit [bacterium]